MTVPMREVGMRGRGRGALSINVRASLAHASRAVAHSPCIAGSWAHLSMPNPARIVVALVSTCLVANIARPENAATSMYNDPCTQ